MTEPPALPKGWNRHKDDEGATYFYEAKADHSYWTLYLQHMMPDGHLRWINGETGETYETRPEQDPLDRYAVTIDRHGAHVPPPLTDRGAKRIAFALAKLPKGWVEDKDASGRVIYRNTATGEVTTERPLRLQPGQTRRAAAEVQGGAGAAGALVDGRPVLLHAGSSTGGLGGDEQGNGDESSASSASSASSSPGRVAGGAGAGGAGAGQPRAYGWPGSASASSAVEPGGGFVEV